MKNKLAEYGESIVAQMAEKLTTLYGGGFDRPNLTRMIKFARMFSKEISATLSHQLSILLVQNIVTPESWRQDFTEEDRRGLTPLFNRHINPYGIFELDMTKRLSLGEAA